MLNAVKFWILFSTLLVAAGWILSAFHELNSAGYGVVFALAAVALIYQLQKTKWRPRKSPAQLLQKFKCRFRRFLPMAFLVVALLTLMAGSLYEPSNGSSTAYRIPRVMHWLAAGQWYWVRVNDVRMNIAGNGFEWHFPPLILLTHGDRFLFLFNWFSFLLLPGLTFSVFTRLQVLLRVAWWWSWILPTGWCFIMQAGSTLDDAFATPFALAALDFALRARKNPSVGNVWFSLLAAALAMGVKQSDILLAIPGLIALWPSARLLLKRPLGTAGVVAACLLICGLPMIIINLHYTGTWAGVDLKNTYADMELHNPFWGIVGNIFFLSIQNFKPPFFPFDKEWEAAMQHFLKTPFGSHFAGFEHFGRLSFGVAETSATLGAGICFLIVISIFAARRYQRRAGIAGTHERPDTLLRLLRWTPWALLLVFMAKVGTFESGRLIASYYIWLFPLFLTAAGQSILVRRRWWQCLVLLNALLAIGLIITSRDRPLFPSGTIVSQLESKHPGSKWVAIISRTYSETPDFEKLCVSFRKTLPADATVLGYAETEGLIESQLWLPYGQREVREILPGDAPEDTRQAGIHYVVLEDMMFQKTHDTLAQWLARYHAVIINQWQFVADPYDPPQRYYLVQLQNS